MRSRLCVGKRSSAFRAGPATLTRHITGKVSFQFVEGAVVAAGEGLTAGFDRFKVGRGQRLIVEWDLTTWSARYGAAGDGGALRHTRRV